MESAKSPDTEAAPLVQGHTSLSCPTPTDDEVESICSELEGVVLTEQETDALLCDALALNKRLKEELRRQEKRQAEAEGGGGRRSLPTGGGAGGGSGRHGQDSVSASHSLPPINPKRGLSVQQRRVYNAATAPSTAAAGSGAARSKRRQNGKSVQRKTHSADVGFRPLSSGQPKRRGTQSAEFKQKPEWNDRFSVM